VRVPGDMSYRLAIQVDTGPFYANRDLLERYLLRPGVLRAFGWRVTQVLTKDWLHAPEQVLERLERVLHAVEPEAEDVVGEEPVTDEDVVSAVESPRNGPAIDSIEPVGPVEVAAAEPTSRPEPVDTVPAVAAVEGPPLAPPTAPLPALAQLPLVAPVLVAAPPDLGVAPAIARNLEYRDAASAKFWQVAVHGTRYTVHYGRIGTAGQTQIKDFSTQDDAVREAEKMIREKLAKGYVDP